VSVTRGAAQGCEVIDKTTFRTFRCQTGGVFCVLWSRSRWGSPRNRPPTCLRHNRYPGPSSWPRRSSAFRAPARRRARVERSDCFSCRFGAEAGASAALRAGLDSRHATTRLGPAMSAATPARVPLRLPRVRRHAPSCDAADLKVTESPDINLVCRRPSGASSFPSRRHDAARRRPRQTARPRCSTARPRPPSAARVGDAHLVDWVGLSVDPAQVVISKRFAAGA